MAVEGQAYVVGDGCVGENKRLRLMTGKRGLIEEDDDIRQDEQGVDDRISPAWVQVFDGDEHTLACLAQGSGLGFDASHSLF